MLTNAPDRHVAILGAGTMGAGMAHRLLTQNYPVTIYSRRPEVRQLFEKAGARAVGTASEAVKEADIVISMVSDDAASKEVWLGDAGALASAKPNAICIESSTISVKFIDELAQAFAKTQCRLLDAPVTGSKPQAVAGELLFLVGGSKEDLEQATPTLKLLSRSIVHLGPLGSGVRMKLINNMLSAVQAASLAEALVTAEKAGLVRESVLDVLTNGAPGSPMVKTVSQRMAKQDYAVNFLLRLMQKDVGYAINLADSVHSSHHTADAAFQLLQQAHEAGWGEKDFSSLIEPLRG